MDTNFDSPIGLALGSGAARGWSHIGVIRALLDAGVEPEVVCGSSAGAVVGAFYAANELDALEAWVRDIDRRKLASYLDPTLRGGLLKARKVFDALEKYLPDRPIESLPLPFAAVATDLATGREVWLRKGSLLKALRASIALPGLIVPEHIDDRWLVDGGLVNPVPVSLCRAMGAASVIAVDLNTTLLNRRINKESSPSVAAQPESNEKDGASPQSDDTSSPEADREAASSTPVATRLLSSFQGAATDLMDQFGFEDSGTPAGPSLPSIYEVISNSINIMQTRVGRSRLAGDPPELLITPRLQDFALLDFDRADEAILAGRRAVAHSLAAR